MDEWGSHLVFHGVFFALFTLPVMWALCTFVLYVSFLEALPWITLGAVIAVVAMGLSKFGIPGRN